MRRFEAWAVLGVSFQSVVPLYATTNERQGHGFSTGKKIPVRKPVVVPREAPPNCNLAQRRGVAENGNCVYPLRATKNHEARQLPLCSTATAISGRVACGGSSLRTLREAALAT